MAPGTARVIATLTSGATPWDVVTVYGAADVTGLQVTCPASLGPREGGECRTEALTRANGAVEVRASWTSSAPAVIDLSYLIGPASSVILIPRGAGQTVITATFLGFRATATVVVTG